MKKIHNIGFVYYLLMIIGIIVMFGYKKNYHVDETFSYGLANSSNGVSISFVDGEKYEPAKEIFENYLTVDEDSRFNYINVWKNQKNDVHPPLYYAILHTICSFFPGIFNNWFALTINIGASLVTLFYLRKIIGILFIDDKMAVNIMSLVFSLSAGILLSNCFLRMYVMTMMWNTILIYLIFKAISDQYNKSILKKYAIVLFMASITHYYCIVFAAFLAASFVCYLIKERQILFLKSFIVYSCIAAVASLVTFPFSIKHIFRSDRGVESIENAKSYSISDYMAWLHDFFELINKELFGSILLLLILVIILLEFIRFNKKNYEKSPAIKYFYILSVSSMCYFLVVSKVAVYRADRYMFPAYSAFFICIYGLLYYQIKMTIKNKRMRYWVVWLLFLFMCVNSIRSTKYKYLYLDYVPLDEQIKDIDTIDCLYFYSDNWRVQYSYMDLKDTNSVVFVKTDENDILSQLDEIDFQDRLLVVSNCAMDKGKVIEFIQNKIDSEVDISSVKGAAGDLFVISRSSYE